MPIAHFKQFLSRSVKKEVIRCMYPGRGHEYVWMEVVPIAGASSKGSKESAHLCSLHRAFTAHIHSECQ